MKKIYLFLALTALASASLAAQGCYETFRSEGIALARKQDYFNAINRFWAALITCTADTPRNHDLVDQIKDAQARWVRDLENSVQREKKAYQEAVAAREQAERAKIAEEVARKAAETNERIAKEKGQRAETLRLTLLADLVRERGKKTDALLLSYLAMQLSSADIDPAVKRAFARAVRDSFTEPFFGSNANITGLQYFNNGRNLLVQAADRSMFVLQPGKAAPVFIPDLGTAGISTSEKTPWILSWRTDPRARLWHADGTPAATLEGHTETIRAAVFSPDGSKIATASRDNTARIWDLQGKPLAVLSGHTGNVYAVQFSPDNRFLLTRASDGTARLWDISGNSLGVIALENNYLYEARLSPTGKSVVALFADGSASLWSTAGKQLRVLSAPSPDVTIKGFDFIGPQADIALQSSDHKIRRYDADGKLLGTIDHPVPMQGFAASADGKILISWAADRLLRLWDEKGQLLQELPGHQGAVTNAVFLGERGNVLSTSKDGIAKLWDQKGNILGEWPLGIGSPVPARFSADGQSIVLVNNDGKSVSRSPFPEDTYRQLGASDPLTTETVARLISAYNVELFEALTNKKGK